MSSTDNSRDEEERGEESIDESVLPPGPTRSTYTPPVAAQPPPPTTSDDELADVIAANLASTTDSFNVIYQLDDIRPPVPDDVPIEQLAAPPPDARILPADAAAAPPPATPPASAASMPSPTQSAVPVDLPPPPEYDAPGVTFVEPEFAAPEQQPEPAVTFDLDADVAEPAPVVEPEPTPVIEPEPAPVIETVQPEPEPEPTPVIEPEPTPVIEPVEIEPEPIQPESAQPEPFEPEPFQPEPFEPEPFDTVAWEPEAWEPEPVAEQPEGDGTGGSGPVWDVPAWTPNEEPAEPAVPSDPAAQAALLAASGAPSGQRPWIPERQSLRDDELAALIASGSDHPGGTLGMMEELERQVQLREEETREFTEWQESMLAVGTPEALAAVESVLPDFSDILSPSTQSIPIQPPAAPEAVTETTAPPATAPPVTAAPVTAPPPAFAAPTSDAPPPFTAPSSDAPPPLVEPPSLPAAWDIPAADNPAAEAAATESSEAPEALIEPAPFGDGFIDRVFTGSTPVITGSVPIAPQELDVDAPDDVDPTDQIPASFDDLLGPNPGTAPIEPILSPRIPEDEVVLGEAQQLERPRVFSLESAGLEPTPVEQRVGRAARMFWMWFAANSSIVSIAFGAVLFSLGLSLRQAIVGVLAGVAISFLPLGLGTLASKRSGQPTMVVSRAAFGVVGNSIPALIAFLSRVFWGAAMLWILARATAEILVGAKLTGGLDPSLLSLIVLAGALVIALVVALFGYGMLAKFQLVVSIISGVLVVGVIALTASYIDIATALTNPDGSWMLAGTVAVLVFSFIGLLWANSSGDLARYQRQGSSGAGAMLWTSFGAAVPTFVLISYGALLAASNEQLAEGLVSLPFDTIGRLLPVWYPAPLIAAVSLSLISGVIVTIYSGGFALKAVGLNLGRPVAAVVTAVLVGGGALLLTTVSTDLTMLFRDLATTIAVPVAAWAGIFAADTMIRNRRYHSESLLRRGGVYPTVHWVNLPAFFVATALGFGLTTASLAGLSWQGFLWPLIGVPLDSALAGTDLGVLAALALGLLVPIVAGIPGIRKQEAATAPEYDDDVTELDNAAN